MVRQNAASSSINPKAPAKPVRPALISAHVHTYLPVRFDGNVVDVLEMPTTTQDLNVFAPEPLLEALLDAAERHGGVMHLLFHPAHVLKEPVASAITAIDQKSERTRHGMVDRPPDQRLAAGSQGN
jgi:hypothetical protein